MSACMRSIGTSIPLILLAVSAQAGPAMFSASFIMHAWGNDATSGTAYPSNTDVFLALPLGHDCRYSDPYTPNGAPATRYCGPTTLRQGYPATGVGTLEVGVGSPASLVIPQSAVIADGITGFLPTAYYPYEQSWTYATFTARPGTFFAGGGPAAADGVKTHTGMGHRVGSWVIHAGANGFGGALGLLGRYGVVSKFVITGKPGTYEVRASWAMVPDLGRPQYQTVLGYTPMGNPLWANPYIKTNTFTNNINGNTITVQLRGTGTLWTTGSVTVYATQGSFTTILHRAGYDIITPGGVRNLQLVTPALTHWVSAGSQDHTGHIGILRLQITPEPAAALVLAAGTGVLTLIYCLSRRYRS
jgi:hypothetical protein